MTELASDNQESVPKLRFPEFRDEGEWVATPLRQLCTPISEKVGNAKLTPVSITAGKGFVSQASKFGRDISGEQYRNYTYLRKGDFAYNRGNSTAFPQGYVCQLTEFDEAAASSAFLCFQLHDGHQPRFVQALFDQNVHGRQLSSFITSGARSNGLLNIRSDDFYGVKLPLPPEGEEQQKIADCLLSLDALIAAETDKLAELRDHKKGLMQQLFPRAERVENGVKIPAETIPRLRLREFQNAGEWQSDTLGSKTLKVGSGVTPKGGQTAYKSTGRPFMRSQNVGWGDLLLDDIAFIDDATHAGFSATEIQIDDVLLNITGASIGRCAVADNRIAGGNVSQHVCIIRVKKTEVIPGYLSQFLLGQPGQSQIDSFQAGGNRQGLNFDQIRSFQIPLPPVLEEQAQIAALLSSVDAIIAGQANKMVALKEHKFGLMQQLFPSSVEAAE